MSIRLKLLVGCLCLTIVTAALGAYAQMSQRQVGALATRIYDEVFLSMSYLRSAQNSLITLEVDLRDHAHEGSSNEAESLSSREIEERFSDILADLKVASVRAISDAAKTNVAELRQQLVILQKDAPSLSDTQILGQLDRLDDSFNVAVEIFAGDGFVFRRVVGNVIDASLSRSTYILIAAVILAFAISLILAGLIVPPLNKAVAIARAIAAGHLDNTIEPKGRDETAQLLRALSVMQSSIREKITRIGDLMKAQASSYDNQIAVQGARFEAAIQNMSQGLCMFDRDQRLVVFNQRVVDMFGELEVGTPADRMPFDLGLPSPTGSGEADSMISELPDGRVISLKRQPSAGGGWVDTFEDVTERHRAEERLRHMALHDALTGLANRVKLREHLDAILRAPTLVRRSAILWLDLDGFKSVNDTLGHPVGDALLRATAAKLQDFVQAGDLIARVGGDEFAIVIRAAHPRSAAAALAQRIIDDLGQPVLVDGHRLRVGASIGIMVLDEPNALASARSTDALFKSADLALYRAKSDGRSTYRFFVEEMDARMQARQELELDLGTALEDGELHLFYQPFVDVEKRMVSGFEALLRWQHPQRGQVSPAEFVPVAEESGLMEAIGRWVLLEACREAASWPDPLKISINLSPVQFRNGTLIADLDRALSKSGLDPSRLQLEVTESLLLQDTNAVLETLQAFRERGIAVSMDDFGTGYSSLGYLSRFPFDKIKIDQSFVRRIEERENIAIIRSVIGLSSAMEINVIAEGVETVEQADKLRAEGCMEMQGYLFSKPLPASQLPNVIIQIANRWRSEDDALVGEALHQNEPASLAVQSHATG